MEHRQLRSYVWAIAHDLVYEKGYQLLKLQKNGVESWDEPYPTVHLIRKVGSVYQYIRISAVDFVWGSVVERDVKETAATAEFFRNKLHGSKLEGISLYLFPNSPMPEISERIEQFGKVRIGDSTFLQSVCLDLESKEIVTGADFLERFQVNEGALLAILRKEPEEIEQYKFHPNALIEANRKQTHSLFPNQRTFVTFALLVINILLFILLTFNGGSENTETLIKFGAKYNPLILEGEWWRLFTAMFLHIGFVHLAFNSLALYYLGASVERMYGSMRFLWIYLVAGLFGSLASFIFNEHLAAGASGAIFGCFGALLYFGVLRKELFFRTIGKEVIGILILNLLIGFVIPSIDYLGHIGGLIGGFLAAAVVGMSKIPAKRWQQGVALLLLIVLTSLGWKYGLDMAYKSDIYQLHRIERMLFVEKNFKDAEAEILQLLDAGTKQKAIFYYYLAVAQLNQDKIQEGKGNLEQAIQFKPDFVEAYLILAELAIQEDQIEKAETYVKQILKLDPKNEHALEILQWIEKQRGNS